MEGRGSDSRGGMSMRRGRESEFLVGLVRTGEQGLGRKRGRAEGRVGGEEGLGSGLRAESIGGEGGGLGRASRRGERIGRGALERAELEIFTTSRCGHESFELFLEIRSVRK